MGLAVVVVAGSMVLADGNIDPTNNFAWSENAGWINFAPSNGGVTVTAYQGLSGYAWAENIGWVQLAYPNTTYLNTSATDWGVKIVNNALQGFAWSENAGWINFNPGNNSQVTIDPATGQFDGYAWGESVGWIHLRGTAKDATTYGVRTTASLRVGTSVFFR
jgi:hypothetical protein